LIFYREGFVNFLHEAYVINLNLSARCVLVGLLFLQPLLALIFIRALD